MAHGGDPFGDLFTVAVIGVGGYLIYSWWMTQQQGAAVAQQITTQTGATTTTGTGTNTASGSTPTPGAYTPPTIQQQMQTLANSNSIIQAQGGQADAYQWATLWNEAGGSSTAIDVGSIFFPNGMPAAGTTVPNASQQNLPMMTLATFLAGIQAHGVTVPGLSGLGQAGPTLITLPVMLAKGVRTNIQIPAGTTPAQLQAQLARRKR